MWLSTHHLLLMGFYGNVGCDAWKPETARWWREVEKKLVKFLVIGITKNTIHSTNQGFLFPRRTKRYKKMEIGHSEL